MRGNCNMILKIKAQKVKGYGGINFLTPFES